MDAGAEFVREIVKGAEVQSFQVKRLEGGEATFATEQLHEIEPAPPSLAPLVAVCTLAGFIDLIRNGLEELKLDATDVFIHVANETTVELLGKEADVHGRRSKLIAAKPVPFVGFTFNRFLEHEDFLIAFASKFVDTGEDFKYVVDVASSLTVGATRTAEDDGLAQKVQIQRGMRLRTDLQIRNRVKLSPFRTFPEVNQPASEFLLRLKGGSDNETPKLALFEADGGKWKLDAINEIRRYLSAMEDMKIPVIA